MTTAEGWRPERPAAGAVRLHRLFGLDLASPFPFEVRLGAGEPPADLAFTCDSAPPPGAAGGWRVLARVTAAAPEPPPGPAEETPVRLDRRGDEHRLALAGVGDFYLGRDLVHCHLRHPESAFLVELRLLGPVLAFWLEAAGLPALHASAVVVGGQAVVFLAGGGGGKSSLAAAMMGAGGELLADDVVAVELAGGGPRARPAYPQMRLWPAEAERFVGAWRHLPRVHPRYRKRRVPVGEGGFGRFAATPAPVTRVYLPARRAEDDGGSGGGVAVEPLAPPAAVVELVRHAFTPRLVAAAGLEARRLTVLARLAEAAGVRRLVFPSGLDRLPEVRDAVLADLAG